MIRTISICAIASTMLFTTLMFSQPQDVKKIIQANDSYLEKYEYYSYAVIDVSLLSDKSQIESVEFSVFAGRTYKIVSCMSGIADTISYDIYDKPANDKTRRLVYHANTAVKANSFEAIKAGTYYFEYHLPESGTENKKSGKIVLVIGLQETDYDNLSKK